MAAWEAGLNAVWALVLREAKIYFREKERIISLLVSPLLFLFVVGRGLSGNSPAPGFTYQQFIFPGVLCMVVLFTSITYGLYIIWDKRLDFLKEVLAAPISRGVMFAGKTLGGMLGGIVEAAVVLLIGAAFILPVGPLRGAAALGLAVLVSCLMTAMGLAIGARMKSMEGFGLVMNFLTWPMFFFSGALFDLSTAGAWLRLAALADPFTYCVDLMRWALLGWSLMPPALDLAVVLGCCVAAAAWGTASFGRLQQTD